MLREVTEVRQIPGDPPNIAAKLAAAGGDLPHDIRELVLTKIRECKNPL